jgi:amidase
MFTAPLSTRCLPDQRYNRGLMPFDLAFGSATAAVQAIKARQICAVELTRLTFDRIDRFNPQLNAYVYQTRDGALAEATRIDEAMARGEDPGPLAGVPTAIKESFAIAGYPCTWGYPHLQNSKAPADAAAVARLRKAGAVILGATNVPFDLFDGQSYNDIYGTTNNPYDLARTPGGSSGGTAAALAAGLAALGLGSDIGGSIRQPAHCCGIFGHKPTLDLVNQRGHQPGGAVTNPGFSNLLSVVGPMARTAEDLELALKALGGPEPPESIAYSWTLPKPRHQSLKDFRIGYILEDPFQPVSSETKPVLESAIHALEAAGAKLTPGWPTGFSLESTFHDYLFMLGAFLFSVTPPPRQAELRQIHLSDPDQPLSRGALADFAAWQRKNIQRLAYRAFWQRYFQDFDAFLTPVIPVPAFPHDHSDFNSRTLATPEGPISYLNAMLVYMSTPVITGLPATVAPIGQTGSGLPIGIQIIGPYLEDATPIELARHIGRETGGFVAPAGF